MTCSLVLFGNSACYHLGDWSPRVTDVLRRIDHMNIFLLIAGTYTPVSFALSSFWRDSIIIGMWDVHHRGAGHPCDLDQCAALVVCDRLHLLRRFRRRLHGSVLDFPVCRACGRGAACRRGAAISAGAIVYSLRKPDPWPKVFGFHESSIWGP